MLGKTSWLSFGTAALALLHKAQAQQYVTYVNSKGETEYLLDDRQPSLYTKEFGDCQGDSLINITRFDAAYYKDNMTVQFHIEGNTELADESVMMFLGVYAYGESRFDMTFNPCSANMNSLCPVNRSVPLEAYGIIPLGAAEQASIPNIALSIPDFEGQAILRLFANSTQSQIACYSAAMTNGQTFSHPAAIGSTIGAFVAIALISSVAVAIFGQNMQEGRQHYAHSVSLWVIFSVLQHIFFTGALSVNFPSVLVAWFSNFGWASGIIYNTAMQKSINQFLGNNMGNITSIGSAATGQSSVDLGGGFQITQIYKRSLPTLGNSLEHSFSRRDVVNASTGFTWYGGPVAPGLPLPGNYSGFAGTLSLLDIPASNAFMTSFLWLLVLFAVVIIAVPLLKLIIEACAAVKLIKTERLGFFRSHWIYYTGVALLRTCYIAFFVMMTLTLLQLAFGGPNGVLVVAAIVFILFLFTMAGLSVYALWYRLAGQRMLRKRDQIQARRSASKIPWISFTRQSTASKTEDNRKVLMSAPWLRVEFADPLQRPHAHDDDDFLIKFGWLSARFRRSRWWFFSAWIFYELIRACFLGGGIANSVAQIFGLLVWEIIAFIIVLVLRPFESNRLNMLMIYFLGFSKVVSTALCLSFDQRFNLGRILTTVIGVIIIVIQGVLTICLLIAIVLGAISSWMSIHRFRETFHPKSWADRRVRYFAHVDQKSTDTPPVKVAKVEETKEVPVEIAKDPYFSVTSIHRQSKIEDDDVNDDNEVEHTDYPRPSTEMGMRSSSRPPSRTVSMMSRSSNSNLPYGARRHRTSWSTRDFQRAGINNDQPTSGLQSRVSMESTREVLNRHRSASMRSLPGYVPAVTSTEPMPDSPARPARRHRASSNVQATDEERSTSFDTPRVLSPTRPQPQRLDTIASTYGG